MMQTKTETLLRDVGTFLHQSLNALKMRKVEKQFLKRIPKFPNALVVSAEVQRLENVTKFNVRVRTLKTTKREERIFSKTKTQGKTYDVLVPYPLHQSLKVDAFVTLDPIAVKKVGGAESVEYGITLHPMTLQEHDQKVRELKNATVEKTPLNEVEDWGLIKKGLQKQTNR